MGSGSGKVSSVGHLWHCKHIGLIMGRFAMAMDDNSVEECISIARVNLRLFEEDYQRGHIHQGYLLDFAIAALEKAKEALETERNQKETK